MMGDAGREEVGLPGGEGQGEAPGGRGQAPALRDDEGRGEAPGGRGQAPAPRDGDGRADPSTQHSALSTQNPEPITHHPSPITHHPSPSPQSSVLSPLFLACCATHLVTDGLITAVYPLLPLMAVELQLSYASVGLLRTALIGSSSLFQLPVGFLADWIAETTLLGVGMLWMSLGFAAMAAAVGFWQLLALTTAAGIGGSAQHPLGTAIVSKAYESGGRATAISGLNFAGDLGKVLLPALAGVVALAWGWRAAVIVLGTLGVVVSVGYALVVRRMGVLASPKPRVAQEKVKGWGIEKPVSFALLSAIGVVDNSTRVAVLTFLPFLMTDKGLDAAQVSLLLTLIFACGAAGKLGCGLLADRFGNVGVIAITEGITALSILAVIPVDPLLLIPVLAAFGFVLNGTSSALYSSVAEMVHVDRRARGYGLFYTLSLGLGTFAPLVYGALADAVGVPGSFVAMALVTLATLPLALAMRGR